MGHPGFRVAHAFLCPLPLSLNNKAHSLKSPQRGPYPTPPLVQD